MKLDFQEIKHNWIVRMVVFSVFLFKNHRKDDKIYRQKIFEFLSTKIGYSIQLELECGPKMPILERREQLIENLLNDDDIEVLNLVVVKFKTSLKEVNLQIDLNKWEKWEGYIYS